MGDDCRLLLQTFDEYLVGFLKRVDKDRAYSTYEDYCLRRRRLAANSTLICIMTSAYSPTPRPDSTA